MNRCRGFSLVELMIAVTLALFVSIAVISVFVGSRSAYQSTSGTAALTDGGRFALDFIQNSVRNAGYMACSRSVSQTSLLNVGANNLYFNFGEALGGYEAVGTSPSAGGAYAVAAAPVTPDGNSADWATWASAALDPALLAPPTVIQGNDVLVVRSTMQNTQPVYVTNIDPAAATFLVTARGSLNAGQFAVISDCADSETMLVTAVIPVGGGVTEVEHRAGGGVGTNTAASFLPLSFQPGSQVATVDSMIYYIGQGADGDGALFMADLYTPPTNTYTGSLNAKELVPDIEAMQVLYGLDTDGSLRVSEYVTADKVPEFNSVMSVKAAVLAASAPGAVKAPSVAPQYQLLGTTVTAPVDTRARQVFEITIAVRNALN